MINLRGAVLGLMVVFLSGAVPATAASDQVPDAGYEALLGLFASMNPRVLTSTPFAEDYMRISFCDDYLGVADNPEKFAELFNKATARLEAQANHSSDIMLLRVNQTLGPYDLDQQQFAFTPELSNLEFEMKAPTNEHCRFGSNFPLRFLLNITNPEAAIGLPMFEGEAKRLLAARDGKAIELDLRILVPRMPVIDAFGSVPLDPSGRIVVDAEIVYIRAHDFLGGVRRLIHIAGPQAIARKVAKVTGGRIDIDGARERDQINRAADNATTGRLDGVTEGAPVDPAPSNSPPQEF